jgi:hypothetical protein
MEPAKGWKTCDGTFFYAVEEAAMYEAKIKFTEYYNDPESHNGIGVDDYLVPSDDVAEWLLKHEAGVLSFLYISRNICKSRNT